MKKNWLKLKISTKKTKNKEIETDVKNSLKSLAHQWIHSCDVFISCLDSHSDGTHLLQRIHWWASDLMLNLSKSAPKKKQTLKNK